MTVLAAVYDRKSRSGAMAADRQVSIGSRAVTSGPKIFRVSNAIFGYCGSVGVERHMHEFFAAQFENVDMSKNLLRHLEDSREQLLESLVELKELYTHSWEQDEHMNAGVIILSADGIVAIDSWLSMLPVHDPIYTDGSGGDVALGYLAACGEYAAGVKESVRDAVLTACEFDNYCSGPVDVFSVA